MQWGPYAMVRITAVLVAGSLLCIYQPELVIFDVAAGLLLALSLLYFLVYRFVPRRYRVRSTLTGSIGLFAILVAGYVGVLVKTASRDPKHLLHIQTSITAYQVKIISAPEEKENSWKRTGDVLLVRTGNGWQTATGKINLYWPKAEQVTQLRYGDVLLVRGTPQELQPPYNPHEFDFKRYLRFKNIYHQHFIREGNWQLVHASDDKGFLYYSQQARTWSLATLKKFISSPREFAIVSALVLGVTDGIDNDLQNAYSASGAMHVLAVSGLHVSIIYGILLFFFRPFTKTKAGHWWVAVISVILLWAYAFITGLSPSVLRAVTMFSFVAIARPAGFTTNIYNTLAASAFCLLLYDPYLIMSVGFQLSYLAVLGIVYIQRPLYLLWSPRSAFVNWV
ncbi:MAG: ComEC family competence protein, partial [Cyclobacteriaceae bacterium]|nr:ComEC family competence protein [Cyclobacteriaceae bacterium]